MEKSTHAVPDAGACAVTFPHAANAPTITRAGSNVRRRERESIARIIGARADGLPLPERLSAHPCQCAFGNQIAQNLGMESSPFELLEPAKVTIAGGPSAGMIIHTATGRTLGQLGGFVVESAHQQIRYLVVRATGLFGKTTLIPFSAARLDVEGRAIEVDVDDRDLWLLRNFTPDQLLPA